MIRKVYVRIVDVGQEERDFGLIEDLIRVRDGQGGCRHHVFSILRCFEEESLVVARNGELRLCA